MDHLHIDCICGNSEHSVRFGQDWPSEQELTGIVIDIQLNQFYTLFDRVKAAVRYIFTGVGHCGWDSTIINPSDIPVLIKYLEETVKKNKELLENVERFDIIKWTDEK